jgi:hypothetical protein
MLASSGFDRDGSNALHHGRSHDFRASPKADVEFGCEHLAFKNRWLYSARGNFLPIAAQMISPVFASMSIVIPGPRL